MGGENVEKRRRRRRGRGGGRREEGEGEEEGEEGGRRRREKRVRGGGGLGGGGKEEREEALASHQGPCLLCVWGALRVILFSRGIDSNNFQTDILQRVDWGGGGMNK